MPPTACRALYVVVALAGAAGPAFGQREYPIKFTPETSVGLPPGRFGTETDAATNRAVPVIKRNAWAPVAVHLEIAKEYTASGLKLRIDSTDGDGLRTSVTTPLAATVAGQLPGARLTPADFGYTPYVRAGDPSGQVTLTLLSDDGRDKTLAEPFRVPFQQFRDPSSYVVVSVGSRLPGFDLPGDANKSTARAGLRGGRVETAALTDVAAMPDQWFGYAAADLVVLPTGAVPPAFLAELFGENATEPARVRREALLEWVRRGGKLVVSVGSAAGTVGQYKAFQAALPAPLQTDPATRQVTKLPVYAQFAGTTINEPLTAKNGTNAPFPVANLGPAPAGRPVRVLIPPPANTPDPDSPPVVVQAIYGLGRVTLVTTDLDQSPFLDYNGRPAVWDYLLREAGSPRAALVPTTGPTQFSGSANTEDELLAALRAHVDTFDGVPVVSFGWVALFIGLYTLVIGPVEYFFLKYVVKRLELTWVTFPLIVVSVSAAAYFTAYAIKGNDLRVNKVDLVDVDLAGGRVTGHSWFTVFSPRIDSYSVGVEPRAGWAVALPNGPPPLVGAMGGGSGGGGGIVSRGYSYHTTPGSRALAVADGLERVPIQVWSTKAFAGTWVGATDPGTPPVAADLFHPPGDPAKVAGRFTNNLPTGTLENAVLIYAGKVYPLDPVPPGGRVEVPATGLKEDAGWFQTQNAAAQCANTQPAWQRPGGVSFGGAQAGAAGGGSAYNLYGVLFHERSAAAGAALANAGLRAVDQSWRVGDGTGRADEALFVARLSPRTGPAEDLLTDPAGPSATTLWLKNLPTDGTPRTPVPGTLRQETYVRVAIPVKSAAGN